MTLNLFLWLSVTLTHILAVPIQHEIKTHLLTGNFLYQCPDGFYLENSWCTQKKNQEASSQCPEGSRLFNDVCTKILPLQKTCPDGFALEGEACVLTRIKPATMHCKEGSVLNNGVCETELSLATCAKGHKKENGECFEYVNQEYHCPAGFRKSGKRCLTVMKHEKLFRCPENHFPYRGACMSLSIQHSTNIEAVNHIKTCAPGFMNVNSKCVVNGQAVPIYISSPQPVPQVMTCHHGNGVDCTQIKTTDIKTECPNGFTAENGWCKRKAKPLESSQIISTAVPLRLCADDFEMVGERCVKKVKVSAQETCEHGTTELAGRCVKSLQHRVICANGGTREEDRCVVTHHRKPTLLFIRRK